MRKYFTENQPAGEKLACLQEAYRAATVYEADLQRAFDQRKAEVAAFEPSVAELVNLPADELSARLAKQYGLTLAVNRIHGHMIGARITVQALEAQIAEIELPLQQEAQNASTH